MENLALWLLFAPVSIYLGYPLVLLSAAVLVPGKRVRTELAVDQPSVSILICAHNEGATIGAKLASVAAAIAAYPGSVETIVGDDGSSDDTAAIVAGFADRGIQLVSVPRGGKAAALNRIVPMARGDIVVMTDADPLFELDTLPAIVAPFVDPAVGAVAGEVVTIGGRTQRFGALDRLFRGYESAMRAAEDRLFGCVSADGGLYAIRRVLVPVVPADVTDDFYISTAVVAAGRRIAFTRDARVFEHSIAGDRQQFRRRVRITVRGMTALWRRRALMNPACTGWYAVALVLHKLARRLAPLTLPPLWVVSGLLAFGGSYRWAAVCAVLSAAGLLALIGYHGGVRLPKSLAMAYGASLQIVGMATGVVLFLTGRRYAQWTPQKDAAA